ncbi:MAG: hypothetical protein WCT28_00125 [Patescibacteria group bacterium]
MSNNKPKGFYINTEGHLVPPLGCKNINEGLNALETVLAEAPEDADSEVIAVPEPGVSPWIFRTPKPNEATKVDSEDSVLYFFWATNEKSGDQCIVMFNGHHDGKEDNLWRIVTSEEWRRAKLGDEVFRLFANANAAKTACPNGLLVTTFFDGPWKGVVVHSTRSNDRDISYCTNPNLLETLGIPDGIPLELEAWRQATSEGTLFGQLLLKYAVPSWTTNLEYNEIGPVIIRMIATSDGGICILVRDDNEYGVRFLWRSMDHEQGKLLLEFAR